MCEFKCEAGFEAVEINPECESVVDLQIRRVGGSRGVLAVITSFFFISLAIWIIIALRSSCIQMKIIDKYT